MLEWLITIIIVYILEIIGTTIYNAVLLNTGELILFDTPKELYDKTEMNWFGCVFVWFLEFLFNPVVWLAVLVARFFYWLFTVGRKK